MSQDSDRNRFVNHDGCFKAIMQDLEAARVFLREFMPGEAIQRLDLDKIAVYPTETIAIKLVAYRADVVFKIPYLNQPDESMLVLLEHKKHNDRYAIEQLCTYALLLRQQEGKQVGKRPDIHGMLICHGEHPYSGPTKLVDTWESNTCIRRLFEYGAQIIDLNQVADEQLYRNPLLAVTTVPLKYCDNSALLTQMVRLQSSLMVLPSEHSSLVQNMLHYTYSLVKGCQGYRDFCESLAESGVECVNDGEVVVRYVEHLTNHLEEVGLQKGMQKGMQKGLKQGVEKGRIEEQQRMQAQLRQIYAELAGDSSQVRAQRELLEKLLAVKESETV